MNHSIIPAEAVVPTSEPLPVLPRLARALLRHQLHKLRYERLRLIEGAIDETFGTVDFIKHFIFPGSCIPSVQAIVESVARTLRPWRERFMARHGKVRAPGYPESFVRMWEYYLCYCESGFEERQLGDVQMPLTKPRSRHASIAVVNAAPA